jgi:hypothetical protein
MRRLICYSAVLIDYGSIGKLKVKINIDSIQPVKYADNRPVCKQRLEATDIGVVLHYGNGPDSCDINGARDLWIYKANDVLPGNPQCDTGS